MKRALLFLVCAFLMAGWQQETNPWTGKWKAYKLEALKRKCVPVDIVGNSFVSEIELFADKRFVKITNGKMTQGKYDFTPNKLIFYRYNAKNEPEQDWMLRWPVKEKDPYPRTMELDIGYPEILNVKDANGKVFPGDVDVLYIKIE